MGGEFLPFMMHIVYLVTQTKLMSVTLIMLIFSRVQCIYVKQMQQFSIHVSRLTVESHTTKESRINVCAFINKQLDFQYLKTRSCKYNTMYKHYHQVCQYLMVGIDMKKNGDTILCTTKHTLKYILFEKSRLNVHF